MLIDQSRRNLVLGVVVGLLILVPATGVGSVVVIHPQWSRFSLASSPNVCGYAEMQFPALTIYFDPSVHFWSLLLLFLQTRGCHTLNTDVAYRPSAKIVVFWRKELFWGGFFRKYLQMKLWLNKKRRNVFLWTPRPLLLASCVTLVIRCIMNGRE